MYPHDRIRYIWSTKINRTSTEFQLETLIVNKTLLWLACWHRQTSFLNKNRRKKRRPTPLIPRREDRQQFYIFSLLISPFEEADRHNPEISSPSFFVTVIQILWCVNIGGKSLLTCFWKIKFWTTKVEVSKWETLKELKYLGLNDRNKYYPVCQPSPSQSDKKLVPLFSIFNVNLARQQALSAELYRNVNTAVPAIREGLEATICLASRLIKSEDKNSIQMLVQAWNFMNIKKALPPASPNHGV